jgi:protein tyrosine/serine phosphatase
VRSSRELEWDGCVNARDLGGFPTPAGPTAYGVFVRSDNARKLTDAGWQAARDYGITTVLDLRSDPECAADPPDRDGFTHVRLSLMDHFDSDMGYRARILEQVADLEEAARHRVLYSQALDVDARRFAEVVRVLARAERGVLIHCLGGKDRTGLVAALLLRLVGVSVEAIDDDYVVSGARLPPPAVTPRGVMDTVLTELGDVGTYLLGAGVTPDELDRIERRLRPQVHDR